MDLTSQPSPRLRTSLISWVLGFLGITALVKFLPRTIKKLSQYALRRWVLGLIAEVVVVVIAGLLTEKLVDRMAARNGRMASSRRAGARESSARPRSKR